MTFKEWWLEQTRKGDPARRANLAEDAWNAARRETAQRCAQICDDFEYTNGAVSYIRKEFGL